MIVAESISIPVTSTITGTRPLVLVATGNFTMVVQRVPVRISISQGCVKDQPLGHGMSVAALVDVK